MSLLRLYHVIAVNCKAIHGIPLIFVSILDVFIVYWIYFDTVWKLLDCDERFGFYWQHAGNYQNNTSQCVLFLLVSCVINDEFWFMSFLYQILFLFAGGAGGKGVWGKPGSELDETGMCQDIRDPNYDSDNQVVIWDEFYLVMQFAIIRKMYNCNYWEKISMICRKTEVSMICRR